ncbi:hypothetical protein SLEP1_g15 [Rubroshorea leprosula]|uniref:DUF4408 domain-containing protein n=1 Tax=Rubroshorea leprosula TaxID=152421 RepID=A0AAV5HET6_9ROSI|nr:hypothetical protein SLEP1_g15 [Rubroshorea leprosula]
MDSIKFDNVKAEKAKALRRVNLTQTLKKLLLLLCELLLAFYSLSWLSKRVPYALQISRGFVRGFVPVLDRPLFWFMLVNLLMLVIFVLSFRKTSSPDIYDKYTGSCWNATGNTAEKPVEDTVVDKQVILEDNAVLEKRAILETVMEDSERVVSPVKQDTLSTVTKTEVTVSAVTVAETKPAFGTVMVVKKKDYRRSRSEMSKNFGSKNRPELQRSDTTIAGTESQRKSMDHLSNEEFNLKIESFIAEQKKKFHCRTEKDSVSGKQSIIPCLSEF